MVEQRTFSEQQAKDLFSREAILIGSTNGVPLFRVAELFGDKAAAFGARIGCDGHNVYGIGDFSLLYLTYRGFQHAVTYYNIDGMRGQAREIVA